MKKLVKSACEDVAFKELKDEIQIRNLKKLKNIKYNKFEIQEYLNSKNLTTTEKKIIFNARTGMLPVGFNFGQTFHVLLVKYLMIQIDTS